jgi:hypothetical protein
MLLALKSLSSDAHSPWCQPVSRQKVAIMAYKSPTGVAALSDVLGIRRQLKCVLKYTVK